MFACVNRPAEQKDLYFTLEGLFALDYQKRKVSGVYVIYKDGFCLYVGQSSNVASRLATHLSGKYKTADRVVIYEIDSTDITDLTDSEKYAIQLFKPIENILADYTDVIDDKYLSETFLNHLKGAPLWHNYQLLINKHLVFIDDNQMLLTFDSFKGMAYFISQTIQQAATL